MGVGTGRGLRRGLEQIFCVSGWCVSEIADVPDGVDCCDGFVVAYEGHGDLPVLPVF